MMVKVKNEISDDFQIKKGLRQGVHFSTLLFNIVFNKIIRDNILNRDGHVLHKSHQVVGMQMMWLQ